jgi:hypothetical protein
LKLTEEDKKYIFEQFLRNVSGISNREYQKRVWIRGEGPEVDDFDETVEHFFDDIELILDQNPKDYKKFELTHKQLHILKVFRDAFKKFSEDNYWPPEFIEMPEWERIIKMAKEVLGAFNYQKKVINILGPWTT